MLQESQGRKSQGDFRKAERHRHTVKTPPVTAAGEEEKRKTHALLQQYSKRSSIEAHPCCLGEETREEGIMSSCSAIGLSVHASQASLLSLQWPEASGRTQEKR